MDIIPRLRKTIEVGNGEKASTLGSVTKECSGLALLNLGTLRNEVVVVVILVVGSVFRADSGLDTNLALSDGCLSSFCPFDLTNLS